MCLAVPMQITQLNGFEARCSARGVERDVSLFLLQDDSLQVGDYVLIHVGYAIQTLSAEQAKETWDLFDQILDEPPELQHA
jgi:hydrogenase expression/formation protein HypC